ncbi:MAG: NAD(P)H-binding protein [Methylacidiphilales bacterium]|nr:NAD(P)H-binding protein [Candidatus Methylacidiphilales bacterium]
MKIAITGGTGFVGGNLARSLAIRGHEVVLIARGMDRRVESLRQLMRLNVALIGTDDEDKLFQAMTGCEAVVHCAGINREIGSQTYQRVHIEGTRKLVGAARRAGVRKIVMLSFLRARPACGSPYHESKWAAEEIIRASGLDYTILKSGMIYGKGDHMLDHLSHSLYTFPLFGSVGFREQPVRPVAVEDVVRILQSSLEENRLSDRTVYVTGPEEMLLSEAVRRVARVIGKKTFIFPMPVWFHFVLGWIFERCMKVPLIALAQVHILAEGVHWEGAPATNLPEDLVPQTSFNDDQIRRGLPVGSPFGRSDFKSLRDIFKCA